ncbi:hypothetical protein V1525DRAFT_372201 [Lipomyces kononenkoae]|uniref:Uncharacterized protein n=1 Tax=Lipomyces kononenkoae TaxID=34357 RepID=A0ACC3T7M0_LIPKO
MSAPTDRAARIASRIRGAGRTRYISNSSFAISMPTPRTSKSADKKKTPQSTHRNKTPGSRRKASAKKTEAAALVTNTSVPATASAVRGSGQVTVFARTPQYAKRSTPLRRSSDSNAGNSKSARRPTTNSVATTRNIVNSSQQSDFEHEKEAESEGEQESEDLEPASEDDQSDSVASQDNLSLASEGEDKANYDEIDHGHSPDVGENEVYAAYDSDADPAYEAPKPGPSTTAPSAKRKARRPTSAGAAKRKKRHPPEGDEPQYVRIMTQRLPLKEGRGAPALSDIDVVSQVISEQVLSSVNSQSQTFRRKVLEAYAEELEMRFSEMCDVVNAQAVLSRAARKARRDVVELRNQLLSVRKERRDIADEVVSIRATHLKAKLEAKAEISVKEVLDIVAGMKSRVADISSMEVRNDAGEEGLEKRIGVIAELQKLVPLVCGQGGILGRLREFNSILEQKEQEFAVV